MANTRTVADTGGDHTTISSAISWFQANHNFNTDGIGTIELISNTEFNEANTISGIAGTPSSTAYLHIKANASNKHSGAAGTGHARVRGSSSGSHVFSVSLDYTMITDLEIQQDSSGSSDECIRVTSGTNDVVISRNILWTDTGTADQDGIYTGNWAATFSADNNIIYGFGRCGIHLQNFSGTNAQTANLDSNTIYNCGNDATVGDGGIVARAIASGSSVTVAAYNNAALDSSPGSAEDWFGSGSGTISWSGSNNASTDASLTTIGLSTNAQQNLTVSASTQSTGSFFVVNSITGGSEDLTLLDDAEGNLAYGNGVDRAGSEPDSRQDLSLDIVGNTRSTTSPAPDIGASEYTAGGGGPTYTLTANAGSYSQSGTNSVLAASRLLTANAGSYTLTGTNAALDRSYTLNANAGAYSVFGTDAELTASRLLTANAGSYSLTGTNAELLYTIVLSVNAGSFTINGTNADLISSRILSANAGSYSLTGTNSDLLKSSLLSASSGSYALTGTNADLTYTPATLYSLTANAGSYALSGTDAALIKSSLLAANAGSYSLTGSNLDLDKTYILVSNAGSYALSGANAALLASRLLNCAAGSYLFNGTNAVLTYSGQLVWTVQANSADAWSVQTNDDESWMVQTDNASTWAVQ